MANKRPIALIGKDNSGMYYFETASILHPGEWQKSRGRWVSRWLAERAARREGYQIPKHNLPA